MNRGPAWAWVALLVLSSVLAGCTGGDRARSLEPESTTAVPASEDATTEATSTVSQGPPQAQQSSTPAPAGSSAPFSNPLPTASRVADTPALAPDGLPYAYRPHVIVGVADSGVNPYHSIYYRPELTRHPCTYIQSMPCSLKALNLSIGVYETYEEAVEADQPIWDSLAVGDGWYWIPRTSIVAAYCSALVAAGQNGVDAVAPSGRCILDDDGHGTGTTSSILMENPEALLAVSEGSAWGVFGRDGIPVDILSWSWGSTVPLPVPGPPIRTATMAHLFVIGAGNDPRPAFLDVTTGDHRVISVGGAYAVGTSEEPLAGTVPDVVSYYCRPFADYLSVDGFVSGCGTSFATPTVAGGLSRVVLAVRQTSGYTGNRTGPVSDPSHPGGTILDPVSGLTTWGLRDAFNVTASYAPKARYDSWYFSDYSWAPSMAPVGVPLNPGAPWLQWGWGFYDGWVANATIDHLLGRQPAPPKPPEAVLFMETVFMVRETYYG